MRNIIATRLMHWKKQWISLLFWLLFPILATIGITAITSNLQDDAKVPIGIVLEEQTDASMELIQEIKLTPFVRVNMLPENKALYLLKKHKLDSVFVIHEGFEEKVLNNNRSQMITSYQSDLSFAYTPVKEMILSYVQQETGRSKAAFVVKELAGHYDGNTGWTFEEIIAKSKEIQQEENLLETSFSFNDSPVKSEEKPPLFSIWRLWAIFSFLATFLLFDWVIKERLSQAITRFAFMRYTLKTFLFQNVIVYSVLLFIIDLCTISLFYFIFGEWIPILNLVVYRTLINLAAFILAQLFKNTFLFYTVTFALTLFIAVSSGAVLPSGVVANWSWFTLINPLSPLLTGKFVSLWSLLIVFFTVIWAFRKERYHA